MEKLVMFETVHWSIAGEELKLSCMVHNYDDDNIWKNLNTIRECVILKFPLVNNLNDSFKRLSRA